MHQLTKSITSLGDSRIISEILGKALRLGPGPGSSNASRWDIVYLLGCFASQGIQGPMLAAWRLWCAHGFGVI